MDEKNNSLEYCFADIVIERPYIFRVGRKQMQLYPLTLAKSLLLKEMIEALPVNKEYMRLNPFLEALRLANACKDKCCQILSIHATPNTKKDLFNVQKRAERKNILSRLGDKDIATLLTYVLTSDKTEQLMRYFGIDKERERMRTISEVKKSKNSIPIGGKTMLGSFIGQLLGMGYTDNEIRYELSYHYLQLMLADKMSSVYLTDEELNSMTEVSGGNVLDGNNPESFGKLQSLLANRGLKIN